MPLQHPQFKAAAVCGRVVGDQAAGKGPKARRRCSVREGSSPNIWR
jgi:hypothetical protein